MFEDNTRTSATSATIESADGASTAVAGLDGGADSQAAPRLHHHTGAATAASPTVQAVGTAATAATLGRGGHGH